MKFHTQCESKTLVDNPIVLPDTLKEIVRRKIWLCWFVDHRPLYT